MSDKQIKAKPSCHVWRLVRCAMPIVLWLGITIAWIVWCFHDSLAGILWPAFACFTFALGLWLLGELAKTQSQPTPSQLIADKMRKQRPTLREYLRNRASIEDKCAREWEAGNPGSAIASYRAGMSYAYRDIERMLERNEFADIV